MANLWPTGSGAGIPVHVLTFFYEVGCGWGGVEEVGAHASQLAQQATPRNVEWISETSWRDLFVLEGGANGNADTITKVNTEE